jgi:rod shape-determining protein MreC
VLRFRVRSSHALLLVCGGLYVAAAAQARGPRGSALSLALSAAVDPVLAFVNAAGAAWNDAREGRRDLRAAVAELAALRDANGELQRTNQLLAAELAALRQGSQLLADFPSFTAGAVLARVVARDIQSTQSLRLDRGGADGVRADAAVLAAGGVLGRVDRVAERSCRVQLLSHPAAAAAARVAGVEREALLLGGERPSLTGLPPYTEVAVGTAVFTTGSEGIYPPGLLLGTTLEARTEGLFTTVDVQLAVHPAAAAVALVLPPGGGQR